MCKNYITCSFSSSGYIARLRFACFVLCKGSKISSHVTEWIYSSLFFFFFCLEILFSFIKISYLNLPRRNKFGKKFFFSGLREWNEEIAMRKSTDVLQQNDPSRNSFALRNLIRVFLYVPRTHTNLCLWISLSVVLCYTYMSSFKRKSRKKSKKEEEIEFSMDCSCYTIF